MAQIISEERWYLTEDGKERVKEDDPRARWLLVPKGGTIDSEVLESYPEAKAIEEPHHTKTIRHKNTKSHNLIDE